MAVPAIALRYTNKLRLSQMKIHSIKRLKEKQIKHIEPFVFFFLLHHCAVRINYNQFFVLEIVTTNIRSDSVLTWSIRFSNVALYKTCNGEIIHQEENSNKQAHKINMTEAETGNGLGWHERDDWGIWFLVERIHCGNSAHCWRLHRIND